MCLARSILTAVCERDERKLESDQRYMIFRNSTKALHWLRSDRNLICWKCPHGYHRLISNRGMLSFFITPLPMLRWIVAAISCDLWAYLSIWIHDSAVFVLFSSWWAIERSFCCVHREEIWRECRCVFCCSIFMWLWEWEVVLESPNSSHTWLTICDGLSVIRPFPS